ncbi:hypothetical protein CAL7716_093880 [Calothrix sp. PCC 7716]|nr:hypothetical protein CAL7716_093880 [Calothrix sp. PCC 7716]
MVTEQQRDALLDYLLSRPYREVAGGVQFLSNAPNTILDLEVPEDESANMPLQQKSTAEADQALLEASTTPAEEFAVLSRV